MVAKLKIIDAICTRHPSLGVEKGWSTYTGGMADTGEWFVRKMLDVPSAELQTFLDGLIAKENLPVIPLTPEEERDSKIIHHLPNGRGFITELERKRVVEFYKKHERKLLFGK